MCNLEEDLDVVAQFQDFDLEEVALLGRHAPGLGLRLQKGSVARTDLGERVTQSLAAVQFEQVANLVVLDAEYLEFSR